jgi:stringent starvation protein B
MLSSRPYLLRAMHEWIVDSGSTPHIIADAAHPGMVVPDSAVQEGKVVLNISPSAVRDLLMDAEFVSFVARFGGVSRAVTVPTAAVEAIYARENGRGMMFSDDDEDAADDAKPAEGKRSGPRLRVVK